MGYFCYIESSILSVPHMEPLAASTPEEGCEEALRLLAQHSSGIAAHVFQGEERVWTLRPQEARP